jgi:F-type H+-transporting ATPase subunit epsilon
MVVARSHRGEFAVLPHHAPLLAELQPGPVRIKTPSEEIVFACSGGVLDVKDDVVSVLVFDAIRADEIDLDDARRATEDPGLDDAARRRALARLALLERVKEGHG